VVLFSPDLYMIGLKETTLIEVDVTESGIRYNCILSLFVRRESTNN